MKEGTAATLASLEKAQTAYLRSGGKDKAQLDHYEARIKELSAAATGVFEVKITVAEKVAISLVDYFREGSHVDIRSHHLVPVNTVTRKKDAEGHMVPHVSVRPEWCRASQGLAIPVSAWPDFVKAVTAIQVGEKSSS